ncbi:hypothetical protein Poli38472_002372 [Pythium oligandrum]|uniref:Glutathione S-transferase n=1 Tax=Pythium oligandrum TaxID=41045 RepID=A0A8K1CIK7_PYTOL|nr:hypothetical protein Poli38472_002372 [Pythium oligandrum]|eukprot:TMW63431.1 hypothetical protein Poli38472_002372 [Pythium oligandrum]
MSPQIKVTYFDTAGRTEFIRLAFAAGDVAFEDERVTFADFPALKPTLPLGQLPLLTVDGKVYLQSMAIARYAGRLGGLYPSDPLEALQIDTIIECLSEILDAVVDLRWNAPDPLIKAEKIKTLQGGKIPKVFGVVDSAIKGKFLLGDYLCLADLFLYSLHAYFLSSAAFGEIYPSVSAFPKIAAVVENVKANPQVAAYLAKRS